MSLLSLVKVDQKERGLMVLVELYLARRAMKLKMEKKAELNVTLPPLARFILLQANCIRLWRL